MTPNGNTLFYSQFYDSGGKWIKRQKKGVGRVLPEGRLPRTTVEAVMDTKDGEKRWQVIERVLRFPGLLSSNTAPSISQYLGPSMPVSPASARQ